MKTILASTLAIGLIAASATVASAIDRKTPQTFAAAQQAKLAEMGYRETRPLNEDGSRMAAIDETGAEVVVLFNPDDGAIVEVVYVHAADK